MVEKFKGIKDKTWSIHPILSCSVVSNSLQPHGLYSPWNSPGQNTGVGSLFLLQGTFPTQGSNPGFPHYRWILYLLSHKGSPGILEWVAYPFSSGSSRPRDQTGVSCVAGRLFTNWDFSFPKPVVEGQMPLFKTFRHYLGYIRTLC